MRNVQKFDFEGMDVRTTIRDDGWLVKRKGSSFNKPTQRAMDMGLFKISESTFTHNSGKPGIGLTPRVTGKGQRFFVDKYCPRNMELKVASDE